MMRQAFRVLEVDLDRTATEGEVESVKRAFEEAGLDAQVEARIEYRSADLPPWAIYVAVAAASGILGGFTGAAGADAWKGLRDLIAKLYRARQPAIAPKGSIVVQVKEVRERILFRDGLPDEAYREIVKIEIRQTNSGQIQWDDLNGEWRDAFDVGSKEPDK